MTTSVVDSPENGPGASSWFVDTLLVETRCASQMGPVGVAAILTADSAPGRHEDIRPKGRPRRVTAGWVPDPRGEQGLICVWVARTRAESAPSLDT